MIACLGFGSRSIDSGPLAWELSAIFEAPVCIGLCNRLSCRVFADRFEQSPPYDVTNLRLVIDNKVLGDSADYLGDFVLPF
jgi:hypothetical protein